jgi:hypothetical protein
MVPGQPCPLTPALSPAGRGGEAGGVVVKETWKR